MHQKCTWFVFIECKRFELLLSSALDKLSFVAMARDHVDFKEAEDHFKCG